jgi:hypothetical protein
MAVDVKRRADTRGLEEGGGRAKVETRELREEVDGKRTTALVKAEYGDFDFRVEVWARVTYTVGETVSREYVYNYALSYDGDETVTLSMYVGEAYPQVRELFSARVSMSGVALEEPPPELSPEAIKSISSVDGVRRLVKEMIRLARDYLRDMHKASHILLEPEASYWDWEL